MHDHESWSRVGRQEAAAAIMPLTLQFNPCLLDMVPSSATAGESLHKSPLRSVGCNFTRRAVSARAPAEASAASGGCPSAQLPQTSDGNWWIVATMSHTITTCMLVQKQIPVLPPRCTPREP